jgi:type III secretory pathway lipoprotein EscJ
MKQNLFFILILLLCCFSCGAQVVDSIQYYSTPEAAAVGFQKSPAKYRDETGQKHLVVYEVQTARAFYLLHSCKRGWYRVRLDIHATAAAD